MGHKASPVLRIKTRFGSCVKLILLIYNILILFVSVRVCRNEGLGNLLVLREILITYAAFHPGKRPESGLLMLTRSGSDGFKGFLLNCLCIAPFAVNPEVSYAQGMNDLCSRFLEVLDCEVDTFWSFSCYMEKFSRDFRADGLHRKIGSDNKTDILKITLTPKSVLFISATPTVVTV